MRLKCSKCIFTQRKTINEYFPEQRVHTRGSATGLLIKNDHWVAVEDHLCCFPCGTNTSSRLLLAPMSRFRKTSWGNRIKTRHNTTNRKHNKPTSWAHSRLYRCYHWSRFLSQPQTLNHRSDDLMIGHEEWQLKVMKLIHLCHRELFPTDAEKWPSGGSLEPRSPRRLPGEPPQLRGRTFSGCTSNKPHSPAHRGGEKRYESPPMHAVSNCFRQINHIFIYRHCL